MNRHLLSSTLLPILCAPETGNPAPGGLYSAALQASGVGQAVAERVEERTWGERVEALERQLAGALSENAQLKARLNDLAAAEEQRRLADIESYVADVAQQAVELQAPIPEASLAEAKKLLVAGNLSAGQILCSALLAAARASQSGSPRTAASGRAAGQAFKLGALPHEVRVGPTSISDAEADETTGQILDQLGVKDRPKNLGR